MNRSVIAKLPRPEVHPIVNVEVIDAVRLRSARVIQCGVDGYDFPLIPFSTQRVHTAITKNLRKAQPA
jgi:hypothetical protein